MPLSLSDGEKNPQVLTFKSTLPSGEEVVFRPIEAVDVKLLTEFLEGLSEQTRDFYILDSYDSAKAQEFCDAINKYDKLRFVAINTSTKKGVALVEYSFDIPEGDTKRFLGYGITLNSKTDCRMGPCIADDYQKKGVGSVLFPHIVDIARKFNKERIILWGGVFEDNKKAITFYSKNGFKKVGSFKGTKDASTLDMMREV